MRNTAAPGSPSPVISVLIFVAAVGLMAYLRLFVFRERFVALTYGLPLLLCLWHRDRRLLWSMMVAFIAMAAYKAFLAMPDPDPRDTLELSHWVMQVINIVTIGATVHAILNLTDRLRLRNEELKLANRELAERAEEISRQNHELHAQAEELSQQNEEIQTQSEELAQQNEELQQQSEELRSQSDELLEANTEVRQREELLQILLDSVRDCRDEQKVLERICRGILPLYGNLAVGAVIVQREGENVVVRANAGSSELLAKQWPAKNAFASVVMDHGRTAYIEDLRERRDVIVAQPRSAQFLSVLATPIHIAGKPAGAVEVYSGEPQKWTARHFQVLEWVAAQASLLLESRRLDRERRHAELALERQNLRLRLLSDSLTHLLGARDIKSVAADLFPDVAQHLRARTYFHFAMAGPDSRLQLNACEGIGADMAPCLRCLDLDESPCARVARGQPEQTVAERTYGAYAELMQKLGLRNYLCNPLVCGDRLVGTLCFANPDVDEFQDDELQFVRTVSQYVSIAVDRLQSEERLHAAKLHLEAEVEKRTAKLQDAVNELEHFSYTITHDMRAPLRSLKGFGDILLEESGDRLDDEQRGFLHKIVKSAERMDGLIRDALNYSKIVREQMPLTRVDTGQLIQGLIQSYPALQQPDTSIEIDGELPPVLGNEAGLTQCFSNLLDNAVKFVRPGEAPRVRIWSSSDNGTVRLWFEDNGIGIREEHQAQLFQMFHRLSRDYEGTGIGLALLRKVAERMGGRVGVDSKFGHGSRFWIELKSVHSHS